MFIGHFAVGLAAKRVAPKLSLAILFLAAVLADMIWPVLVALGIEQVRIDPGNTRLTPLDFVSYPYSHSLVLLVVWGALFGLAVRRRDPRAFGVVTALVVSHWVLDFITHRPDMPLLPVGGPKLGLSLWNSVAGTVIVEAGLYLAGAWIYLRSTRARDGIGRWGILSLLALLLVIYVSDVAAAAPPPSVMAIVIVGLIGGSLTLVWAAWADRHRVPVTTDRR